MNIPSCFATLSSVPSTIALLALAGALGVLIGRISVRGVSIGAGGALFASLALGHLGFDFDSHLMEFLRDAGLAVFVYTIGIQIGPLFLSSFKKEGLRLNILAAFVVSSGFAVAAISPANSKMMRRYTAWTISGSCAIFAPN
jgi:putative transport protein